MIDFIFIYIFIVNLLIGFILGISFVFYLIVKQVKIMITKKEYKELNDYEKEILRKIHLKNDNYY